MSDCCSSQSLTEARYGKYRCPVNGRQYNDVSEKTIMHHIKKPWAKEVKSQKYYYCDDPECEVVYFGQDDSVIEKFDVRTSIGNKEKSGGSLLCYCFGVTVDDAALNPAIKKFVVAQTKTHRCECVVRNPSGRCCLKNF